MTTNYKDRLDPALIRPGRVDVQEFIGPCDQNQIKKMFQRFYPEEPEANATIFAKQAMADTSGSLSAAQIQGFLMLFKTNPAAAIENMKSDVLLSKKPKDKIL